MRLTVVLLLMLTTGCSGGFRAAVNDIAPSNEKPGEVKNEIPDYTAEQLKQALRSASQLLVNRVPATEDLREIDLNGIEGYKTVIQSYMQSTRFRNAMRDYHLDYFGTFPPTDDTRDPTINYNEPANLATHIIVNDLDYREIVLADYCVNDNLVTGPCDTFQGNQGVAPQFAAGAMTTRAFLNKWNSAYNFKRVAKAFSAFACSEYPDPLDVGMDVSEISNVDKGSTNDFDATTGSPVCYSCHRSMNARAVTFLNFARDGFFFQFQPNGEYPNSVPVEERVVTDLNDVVAYPDMLLNTGTVDNPVVPMPRYKGKEIPSVRAYAELLTESSQFKECLVRRFSNFMLGRPNLDPLLNGLKPVLETANGFNVKEVILDISTRPEFVLRD